MPEEKRQRGDGRIFLRGSTYWIAFYLNGREERESTKTADRETAEEYLRVRINRLKAHKDDSTVSFKTESERTRTVNDLLDDLEVDFEIRHRLSAPTRSHIKTAREFFGPFPALALETADINHFIRWQRGREKPRADATINRVTQLLRQAYRFAKINPPDLRITQLDETGNERQGFFSESGVRRVIANLPEDVGDFVLFAWLTGMRRKEIASLAWKNVDGNSIVLQSKNAKNKHSRLIPIEGELADLIERRQAARSVERANGTREMADLIFHREGQPVREFKKSWATACKKAGVPRLFHDLRRSAVRNMVRAGVSEHVAMKISGHRTRSMFDRYNIVAEADLRTALRQTQTYLRNSRDNVIFLDADSDRTRTAAEAAVSK